MRRELCADGSPYRDVDTDTWRVGAGPRTDEGVGDEKIDNELTLRRQLLDAQTTSTKQTESQIFRRGWEECLECDDDNGMALAGKQ